ncbi:MBL fold metallo-hydrolase [Longispora albida]|uniref:MBL fold metallo-hydrolase n=1 Tax=Longispora albida TaxID=203523 RepID=UPI00036D3686|nr:MBL fold metallo-hydrolase [Longispora albida]
MRESLQHIAGQAWLYPADPDPAKIQAGVGVIVTEEGSVIVDAGYTPGLARDVQAAIAEAGLPPARWLVYTHHHWDHVWGAGAWDGVEVIGHESGYALLAAEAARPWSHRYLAEQMAADPRLEPSFTARAQAMAGWAGLENWADDGFAIRLPDRTFTDRLELPGGVQVRHVGGQHAPDSTIVTAGSPGPGSVMFVGDCYFPPPYHLRQPGDRADLGMAKRLLSEGYDWFVDSHSPPRRRADVSRET